MAVVQTGSTQVFNNLAQTNSGTVSSTITVPSDADFVLVGLATFGGTNNMFTGGGMTFTKGGVDTAMSVVPGSDDQASSFVAGPLFYLALPDTGSNKTLKWDWAGSGTNSATSICSVRFYKNVASVRDSDAVQNWPLSSAGALTLTTQAGDLVVGFVGAYNDSASGASEGSVNSFQNLSNIENLTHQVDMDAAWGDETASGTSLTVSVTSETNLDDGSLSVIVLVPSAGGPGTDSLTASNFDNSAPVLGAPAMNSVVVDLTAANLTNTAPVIGAPDYAKSDPKFTFLGVSSVVSVTATGHTLVTTGLPTLAEGDLLIACIGSRIASTTSVTLPTGGEWSLIAEQKTNNVLTTTSAVASGLMASCIRGASDPNLTFTHPTAPSIALGRIVAYRPTNSAAIVKDTQVGTTTAINTTSVSTTGLTAAQINELLVRMLVGGQEAAWSAFNAATSPNTSSGTNSSQTADPISGTWQERADSNTATGADMSLAIGDAVKPAAGATGNLTATASLGAGHVSITAAFYLRTLMTSAGLTNSAPTFGAPAISQSVLLSSTSLTNTAPVIGAPVLSENTAGQTFVASSSNATYGHDTRTSSGGRVTSQAYNGGVEAADRIAFAFFFVDGDDPNTPTDPVFHVTGEADVPAQMVGSQAGGGSYIAWAKIPAGGPITLDVALPTSIYMEAMFFLYGGSTTQFDVAGDTSTGSSVNIDRADGGTTIGWMLANSVTGWGGTSPVLDSVFNNTIFGTNRRIEIGVDLDTVADTNTTISYSTAQRVLALSLDAPSTEDNLTASNLTNTSPGFGSSEAATQIYLRPDELGNISGDSRRSIRMWKTLQADSKGLVSVTFVAPADPGDGQLEIGSAGIGKLSGTGYNTTATPIQLTFDGGNTGTPPRNGFIQSDYVDVSSLSLLEDDTVVVILDIITLEATDRHFLYTANGENNIGVYFDAQTYAQATVGTADDSFTDSFAIYSIQSYAAPGDHLAASVLTNTAPVLGPATIKQIHPLTAAALTNIAPSIGAATFAQKHLLSSSALTNTAPVIGAPVLGVIGTMACAPLTNTAPVLGPATLGQRHVLSAANLANTTPVLGPVTVKQIQVFAAAALANSAPAIGSPALGQKHVLAAAALANSAPVLGPATLAAAGAVLPAPLANTSPVLGPATIGQKHVLGAASLTNSAPVLGAAVYGRVLAAASLTPASPVLGPATLGQRHVLAAAGLANSSPDVPALALGVVGVMACAPLTNSAPVFGSPPIGQIHVLGAATLVNSAPALGLPALVGNVSLSPAGLANSAPALGPATLGQRHVLTGSSLTNLAPELGDPQIVPGGVMAALKLTNSAPMLGTPAFAERYSLIAAPLANDSPLLGPARLPAFLRAANFENGVPSIPGARLNPRYWTKPNSLQGRLNSSVALNGKLNGSANLAGQIDNSTDLEGGW